MKLYTWKNREIRCYQCKKPKLKSSVSYDCLEGSIDGMKTYFYFFHRNNATKLYFIYNGAWYQTDMMPSEDFDLVDYIRYKKALFKLLI